MQRAKDKEKEGTDPEVDLCPLPSALCPSCEIAREVARECYRGWKKRGDYDQRDKAHMKALREAHPWLVE